MTSPKAPIPRRGVIAGAGAVGALAAAATVLRPSPTPDSAEASAEPTKANDAGSGYRVTEHIRRYYATARI
jgi:hypothetical protein